MRIDQNESKFFYINFALFLIPLSFYVNGPTIMDSNAITLGKDLSPHSNIPNGWLLRRQSESSHKFAALIFQPLMLVTLIPLKAKLWHFGW